MTLDEAREHIKCKENLLQYFKGKHWRSLRSKFKKEHDRLPKPNEVQSLYDYWLENEADDYRRWEKEDAYRRTYVRKQIKGNYSFDLVYDPKDYYYPLEVSAVYVSGICVIAKNEKYGGFYFSKYIQHRDGKFKYVAGSHNYPILYSDKIVTIKVKNFPRNPLLSDSIRHPEGYRCWRIKNIKDIPQ